MCEDALVDAWAHWDQSLIAYEDALVASAPPRGAEPLCTLTIHGDSMYGLSDHSPSQEFVAVASMLLPTRVCSVSDGNSKSCRCCQSSTYLFPVPAAVERHDDICVLRWPIVHAWYH